ncbi:phage tail protein [Fictibacillus sp. 26RED30]|uniref:phage tail protein n=1 Tax=Fictibacillus sp. 26RED30 TaxID=2745877 RepID=UPI0018CFD5E6|nr:hypothetical protein [Fictibacillus sp. 26RED30]MBH0159887.1 hypothetical protein [Fictibacillus sp. 26RED30]
MSEKQVMVVLGADIGDFQGAMNKIKTEMKNVGNKIDSAMDGAQKSTENAASGMKGALAGIGGAIAGAFAADKVVDWTKTILGTTADMQALDSQYSQVMGGMKADTDKYLDEMSAKWNKHPNELKSAYMQYVALLKSKGLSEKDAHGVAKQWMDRTVDANAFANEKMEDTVGRVMAGMKGEYDSLDTAMINLSQTMLNDKAQEEYGKKWEDLTVAQQETLKASVAFAQHQSSGVMGQGAREADSYQNNLSMLKNTWDTLVSSFGTPILEAVNGKLKSLGAIVQSVKEWFDGLSPTTKSFISSFAMISAAIMVVVGVIAPLVAGIMLIGAAIGVSFGVVIGVGAAIIAGILAIVAIGVLLYQNWDKICKGIGIAWEWLKAAGINTWNAIKSFLNSVWEGIKSVAVAVFNGIKLYFTAVFNVYKTIFQTAWNGLKSFLSSVWNGIKALATAVFNGITSYFTSVFNGYKVIIQTVWNGIKTFLSSTWNGISSIASSVWNGIKNTVSNVANGVKSSLTSAWNSIKSTTQSVWNGVKSAITSPIESAKSTLLGVIGTIKSAFSGMNITIPKPKLPKVNVGSKQMFGGKGGIPAISVPTFSVDWFATGAIVKGSKDGQVVGVGENGGDEAIVPLSNKSRMKPFAHAVARMMPKSHGDQSSFTQNLTINSNRPLSPSEIARRQKQALREAAMEWGL